MKVETTRGVVAMTLIGVTCQIPAAVFTSGGDSVPLSYSESSLNEYGTSLVFGCSCALCESCGKRKGFCEKVAPLIAAGAAAVSAFLLSFSIDESLSLSSSAAVRPFVNKADVDAAPPFARQVVTFFLGEGDGDGVKPLQFV